MIVRKLAPFLLATMLLACAQVREPEGGPKDDTPPRLVAAEPAQSSVRFTGDRILLHFDERIRTQRVSENLIISPPLSRAPKVSVVGPTDVLIELRGPLAPNTTYTFNIGDAVTNLSEGLAAEGLSFVFSTGDHLDSAEVRGQVVDAFSGKPAEGMIVLLMEVADSTAARIGPPAYFTRSDKMGAFTMRYVRPGNYRIGALKDMNANYRFDLPNEVIAFLPTPIHTSDTLPHLLRSFIEVPDSQRILSSRTTADRALQVVFAKPYSGGIWREVDRQGAAMTWSAEPSVGGDTVHFWPSDTAAMNGMRWSYAEDGVVLDTITYRVPQKMPYSPVLQALVLGDTAVRIRSSRPLAEVRRERVLGGTDSLHLALGPIELDPVDRRTLWIRLKDREPSGDLILMPGAVKDIYGGPNDTLKVGIGAAGRVAAGDLVVRVPRLGPEHWQGPWIMQLLDGKEQVVRSATLAAIPGEVSWPATPAGRYELKLIADRDGNGRWTTGSLRRSRLPEEVMRNAEGVQVRADWDVELVWKLVP